MAEWLRARIRRDRLVAHITVRSWRDWCHEQEISEPRAESGELPADAPPPPTRAAAAPAADAAAVRVGGGGAETGAGEYRRLAV